MKITLDRKALRALVDDDPEFELELKSALLSELGRRFYEKDARRLLEVAQPELLSAVMRAVQEDSDIQGKIEHALQARLVRRSSDWYSRFQPSPEVKAEIQKLVDAHKSAVIDDAVAQISKAYSDAIAKAVADVDVESRIEKRVNRLTDEEINRRAKEMFDAKMAEMKALLP
ncbi:hypothetical protein [Sphingopyxis flava]|uniref:Uncharacterized protein n=1 Tax=Sphingopyxis flava TaxID=1507287 RepID=A0A1T5CUM9_9SPHN|nr:hypothetical protein [Sphingopyxis flava]SKB63041.1 hypothetical protein SAMN06295937_1011125 [Sphingopyxis flava]